MPLRDFEKDLAPPYIKRNFVNYEIGDGNKLFINSMRNLNIKTTQDLQSVIRATATVINTVITNFTDFVMGRTKPSKYYKWALEFVNSIVDEERQKPKKKEPPKSEEEPIWEV